MVRSSAIFKSFLNRRFSFLLYLKRITVISKLWLFSLTQIPKFRFHLMDTFFYCLNPFLGFFSQSNPHSEDSLLVLRNAKVPQLILYMWIVNSLKRTIRWNIYHRFKSFTSSSVMKELQKYVIIARNIYFTWSTK